MRPHDVHSGQRNPSDGQDRRLNQRLYSVDEAATYLGISPWTVREMIWRGDLACIRLGRRVLLDLQDLDRLIIEHKQ